MTVMDVLASKLRPGTTLHTPARRKEFVVESISPIRVTLRVGPKGKSQIRIRAECWNGIPQFLQGTGEEWVKIGAVHEKSKPKTLEEHTDRFVSASAASYVAAVLERVGIVEIDRHKPCRVRLIRRDL